MGRFKVYEDELELPEASLEYIPTPEELGIIFFPDALKIRDHKPSSELLDIVVSSLGQEASVFQFQLFRSWWFWAIKNYHSSSRYIPACDNEPEQFLFEGVRDGQSCIFRITKENVKLEFSYSLTLKQDDQSFIWNRTNNTWIRLK